MVGLEPAVRRAVTDKSRIDANDDGAAFANQARGLTRLLRTAEHEVRGRLGVIALNLELLKETTQGGAAPDFEERRQRCFTVVNEELARLGKFVSLLLDHALSSEAGGSGRSDLRDVVRGVEALLAPQCVRHQVVVETTVPSTPVDVAGGRRVRDGILDVLLDALDVLPSGSRLGVGLEVVEREARVTVRGTDADGTVRYLTAVGVGLDGGQMHPSSR